MGGGVGGSLPGVLGPEELDGRIEWVPIRPPRDLPEALAARLGSDDDAGRLVLGVLGPLRQLLEGEPLGAIVAKLPLPLARELADAELNLCAKVAPAAGAAEYLAEVSRLVLHPPETAATYVRAVFAAAKAVLAPEEARAVEARLPPEIAELWRGA
ncbi:MAG TPA: DUF2267 domain-containing protein [Anaeromyxobacter sp.]